MLFASRATTQMRPLRRNPDGTGLTGRSAVSRRSPMGATIGFAPLRASHPGKPPSRPRGTYSEVPSVYGTFPAVLGRAGDCRPGLVAREGARVIGYNKRLKTGSAS